jgi:hypothetical protein
MGFIVEPEEYNPPLPVYGASQYTAAPLFDWNDDEDQVFGGMHGYLHVEHLAQGMAQPDGHQLNMQTTTTSATPCKSGNDTFLHPYPAGNSIPKLDNEALMFPMIVLSQYSQQGHMSPEPLSPTKKKR